MEHGTGGSDMNDSDAADVGVRDVLRLIYREPAAFGQEYWNSLESRVMARIPVGVGGATDLRFWTVLERWSRVGIAAALLAVAGSAMLLTRERVRETRFAYEEYTESGEPEFLSAPLDLVTQRDRGIQREAMFRLVLSH